MSIDGKEVEDLICDVGLRIRRESSYVVRDTFESVAHGQPRRLTRSFESLSSSAVFEIPEPPATEEESHECKLEGYEVIFTWDEEEQVFDAAFAEGQTGEDYLLSGLDEDMDLRWLLPTGEVAAGDDWEIDIGKDILSPGGDLRIWDHEQGPDEIALGDALRESLRTKVIATYEGHVVEEGIQLASINIRVESETSAESPGGMRVEDSSSLKGNMLWDQKRGHMRTVLLTGTTRLIVRQRSADGGHARETVSEFTGDVRLQMTLDRE